MFYGFATLYAIVTAILQKYSGLLFQSGNYVEVIFNQIYNYAAKFIFIFFSIILAVYLIKKGVRLIFSILIHTCMSIILSIYSAFSLVVFEKYILGVEGDITSEIIFSRVAYGSTFNFFIYFTIITSVHAFYYLEKQKEDEIKRSNLKSQLLDSKIKALQSQLQPHFLFNALNGISSLIDIDKNKSQNALIDLSNFLRSTLKLKDSKFHSLDQELKLVKSYLAIEQLRYAEKLKVNFKLEKSLTKYLIPPLIIQPLIENSMKHGFSYNHDQLQIDLIITKNNKLLKIVVENNGKPLDENGIILGNGLSNVVERLKTLFKNEFEFDIVQKNELLVKTEIILPLIE